MDDLIQEAGSKIVDLNEMFYINRLPFSFGKKITSEEYSDGLLDALTELATKSKEIALKNNHQ